MDDQICGACGHAIGPGATECPTCHQVLATDAEAPAEPTKPAATYRPPPGWGPAAGVPVPPAAGSVQSGAPSMTAAEAITYGRGAPPAGSAYGDRPDVRPPPPHIPNPRAVRLLVLCLVGLAVAVGLGFLSLRHSGSGDDAARRSSATTSPGAAGTIAPTTTVAPPPPRSQVRDRATGISWTMDAEPTESTVEAHVGTTAVQAHRWLSTKGDHTEAVELIPLPPGATVDPSATLGDAAKAAGCRLSKVVQATSTQRPTHRGLVSGCPEGGRGVLTVVTDATSGVAVVVSDVRTGTTAGESLSGLYSSLSFP